MESFVQTYSVSPYDVTHVGSKFATKCCFTFLCEARALHLRITAVETSSYNNQIWWGGRMFKMDT